MPLDPGTKAASSAGKLVPHASHPLFSGSKPEQSQIINDNNGGVHTTTQMGSGHFPSEGLQHSAFIKHIQYVDMNSISRNASSLNRSVSDASYYDLALYFSSDTNFLSYFYFGGPGLAAPVITSQPQSQTVNAGASVGFSVIAVGVAPLNYQWFFNGQPISAATGYIYSIARVQSSQAGTYTVVVSNSYGSVLSAPATLVIASGSGAFGVIGARFKYQIIANNNPTWYSASGLPSGLSCDGATGVISGTPTQTGTFSVYVEASACLH